MQIIHHHPGHKEDEGQLVHKSADLVRLRHGDLERLLQPVDYNHRLTYMDYALTILKHMYKVDYNIDHLIHM